MGYNLLCMQKETTGQNTKQITIDKLTIKLHKLKPNLGEMTKFKTVLDKFNAEILQNYTQTEETQKQILGYFLKNSFDYEPLALGRKDFMLKDEGQIQLIIENKRVTEKKDMASLGNLNTKSLQELILYYFRERKIQKEIKHLIITNQQQFFVFQVQEFERVFATKSFLKEFEKFENGGFREKNTDFFYNEIAKLQIEEILKTETLEFCHFDITDFANKELPDLVGLYKVFCPENLFKKRFADDNNDLNKQFYLELLYIMGLEEIAGGKIGRIAKNRQLGSLLENTLDNDKLKEDFEVALELVITWINRVLFIKLLEGQIANWHSKQKVQFVSKIKNYGDLNDLFFEVLAKLLQNRKERFADFEIVPYLNSSLFEKTNLEKQFFGIDGLRSDFEIEILTNSVLSKKGKLQGLDYLLQFLSAFDFGSEGKEISVKQKSIINASVLGNFFEKLNGYKDGSFYTPSMITMNMAQTSLVSVILTNFETEFGYKSNNLRELRGEIRVDKNQRLASDLVDKIKILEPSVGSGHLLVSCLNQLIWIKHELGILLDQNGYDLDCQIEVQDDELVVLDRYNNKFEYILGNKESQNIQKTLFEQKQKIIENCLFGVDINPNSIKICQLRLWIELLKHSFYKNDTELETLPNIDINIKTANSLLSRFEVKQNLVQILKSQNLSVADYKTLISDYYSTGDKNIKAELVERLTQIKDKISQELTINHPINKQIEILELKMGSGIFELDEKTKTKIQKELIPLLVQKADLENGKKYKNSMEWRFEFPQVLDWTGAFVGFDLVIANPPYIGEKGNSQIFEPLKDSILGNRFYAGKMDLFYFFFHLGLDLLKPKGILHFITTSYYTTATGAIKLRQDIRERANILELINFGELKIFDSALGQHNLITMLQKKSANTTNQPIAKTIVVSKKSKLTLKMMANILKGEDEDTKFYSLQQDELWANGNLKLTNGGIDDVLDKMLINSVNLGEICEINNGIHTQADYLSNKKFEERNNVNKKIGDGIYVLSKSLQEDINVKSTFSNDEKLSYLKPFYKNSDILKYKTSLQTEKEILYLDKSKHELDKLPNIKKHLLDFENLIKKASDNAPYLHRPKKIEFELPKIVAPQRSKTNTFGYNETSWYASADVYFITQPKSGYNLKFLLGVLNSRLIYKWLYNRGKRKGEMLELYQEPLSRIPIPVLDTPHKQGLAQQIEVLVNEILRVKENTKTLRPLDTSLERENGIEVAPFKGLRKAVGSLQETPTAHLETQIDQLVYQLYDLTTEEITILQ